MPLNIKSFFKPKRLARISSDKKKNPEMEEKKEGGGGYYFLEAGPEGFFKPLIFLAFPMP